MISKHGNKTPQKRFDYYDDMIEYEEWFEEEETKEDIIDHVDDKGFIW